MPRPHKLFLIDAHALCYRAFFAIRGLSTSYGQPTNAVYGFVNTLRKILREHKPQYLAVCFDVGKKTFRQEKFAEYKIHRPVMPDELISQIPLIKDIVAAYRLPIFELEGYEADDVIATITKKIAGDVEVVIVSEDKDMMQLLDKHVTVFHARKNEIIGYTEAKLNFGFEPNRIVDYIGLAGDATDNIPGVMGIGEVTAKSLLKEFGSLEQILANSDKISSDKTRAKIEQQKEQAIFSKALAMLDTNVPLPFELKQMKVGEPDGRKLFELFKKMEFKKFADEFSGQTDELPAAKIKTVNTQKEIAELVNSIKKKGQMTFLLGQASGEHDLFANLAVCLKKDEVCTIANNEWASFKEVFEDERISKITHDIKEARKVLLSRGIMVRGEVFDVMLAGYLLSPAQGHYDLEALAWEHLKTSLTANTSLEARAGLVFSLFSLFQKELQEKSLFKLFTEIEIPLSYVLFRMETDGVHLNKRLLEDLSLEAHKRMETMMGEIYGLAGTEFNINSPKQLSQILFERLKLPVVKKIKTGFSTNEEVLVKLSQDHRLPALLLEYRQLMKLKSTYFDVLPKLANPQTHRLHAYFNQTGTETGRLSSNNPNLQNIPIRTELGRQIRKAFIARDKDHVLISADYSQIELRILAHLSGDENLTKAFQNGEDIHNFTATLIFDVQAKAVTPPMRDTAKRVNFGVIYGMSAFGLSKDLGISQTQAQDFIDRYFLRYAQVKSFIDEQIKRAEEMGYVLTILNRRRYLPEIKSSNMAVRQFAQRQAVNTPIQGTAADLIKVAMINIQRELEKRNLQSRMIISVHDELVFDVLKKEKAAVIELVRDKMENTLELSVPVKVSIKVGGNWLEMEKV